MQTRRHRATCTYLIDVIVALLLSASASAVAPASPIWLFHRLREERRVR
jgi:hypothetical protein